MKKSSATVLLALLASAQVLAQDVNVPLRNWTVPPYTLAAEGGGLATMTDIPFARVFVPIQPCRIADTRGNGFTGQAGPPAITTGPRVFQITGTVPGVPAQCGIPPAIGAAVSVQFTIVFPSAAGNLVAWPGGAAPTVSVLNWSAGETALGNAAISPLSSSGSLTVQLNSAAGATAHLVIDVNGYFASRSQSNMALVYLIDNSSSQIASFQQLSSGSCASVNGFCGVNVSLNSAFGRAVAGFAGAGGDDSAGIYGTAGVTFPITSYQVAGVRGQGSFFGVLGISPVLGTGGSLVNAGGGEVAWGALGHATGTNWGVYAFGPLEATGAKSFADPHPTDPAKVIRYISLEGNEPGTYFRGRGKFERGIARIAVPEDFRLVTDPEGITVQVTPIGGMASVGVLKMDLNEIMVQSSRNLEFSYLVQGVRRSHKHLTSPIGEGSEFMPRSAEATMPLALTEEQKRLLIQNGTYREDGTVNVETARRLGWDRVWEERARPAPVATP